MNRVSASLLFSAVVVGIAACADSTTKVTEPVALHPVLSSNYPELNDNYKHIMKLKDEGKKDAQEAENWPTTKQRGSQVEEPEFPTTVVRSCRARPRSSRSIGRPQPMHPSTLAAPRLVPARGTRTARSWVISSTISADRPTSTSTQPYTDGNGAPIANIVNYTSYWANTSSSAPSGTASVSDGQMIAMLQSGFSSGALAYDASTLYLILTKGKVNLGGGFGTQYCAYHTHGTVTIGGVAKTALYAAQPYNYAFPPRAPKARRHPTPTPQPMPK